MIRVNQIKVPLSYEESDLTKKVIRELKISSKEIKAIHIVKKSIDARKKPDIFYSLTLDVELVKDDGIVEENFQLPDKGKVIEKNRPVIVGMGPAGIFCGYYLALLGYHPLLIERGDDVDTRCKKIENFWNGGSLDVESNVQFGEGGAGTFSDGKLNTLIKDKEGRNREILKTFVKFGAPENILYDAKPHIGTDILADVIKNIRNEIINLGGEVRFQTKLTNLIIENNELKKIILNDTEELSCNRVILAIGHSARDTFQMLEKIGLPMEAKSFAVGFRVEHPQKMINLSQYGKEEIKELGAAAYKLTAKTSFDRGVYSFCMCPGGYVVNASSEEKRLVVNGMSYSDRGSKNSNSAIIVSVTPQDFEEDGPLAGMYFQRKLEEKAYQIGKGAIPIQQYGEFKSMFYSTDKLFNNGKKLTSDQNFDPCTKGKYVWANLSEILPKECNLAFIEGMEAFGRKIKGFNGENTILLGVESRTSSPVRIHRDEKFQSLIKGIFPCGEGAGYAGGITSAAMDGLKIAEYIIKNYEN